MSCTELPASKEHALAQLKARVDAFVSENSITRFDGDDIVELLAGGESIDWIVGQLEANSPGTDQEAIRGLLAEILAQTGPPGEPEGAMDTDLPATEPGIPGATPPPATGLDISRIADALPPGMKLPPGVDMKQISDLIESPQGKIMADFLLFCSEKGIELDENLLEDPRTKKLQEEWKSTPRDAFEGRTPGDMMPDGPGGLFPEKIRTFRREEPRIGRNDPCPCGSGKKYKKCCGRA